MKYQGKDIDEMTGSELVKAYNAITGSEVKRFSNTVVGRKRVKDALEAQGKGDKKTQDDGNEAQDDTAKKPTAKKAKQPVDPDASSARRAAAQSKSWTDPEVREKRRQRNGVRVRKEDYRSVKQAFEMLGLPLAKHIKFRAELKASPEGKLAITHEGTKYTFTLLTA